MDFNLQFGPPEEAVASALVVFGFEKPTTPHPFDERTGGWISEAYTSDEFAGTLYETLLLHKPKGLKAQRVLLLGAGTLPKLTSFEVRRLGGAAVRAVRSKAIKDITFFLEPELCRPEYIYALTEGAILADYEPDEQKTDPEKAGKRLTAITVRAAKQDPSLKEASTRAVIVAEAQNSVRLLINRPANLLTPSSLADHAQQMAAKFGLDCEILDRSRMEQLGMGALLGVAQGSAEPPAFIILRYRPTSEASADHLALIGKGVTFDTGGISIKPSDGMEKMRYDMAGGGAVIGAMQAIAQLKPGVRVTGFVPAVENMVSSRAQRPGDIVTSLAGKTVEVLNTDAEGRLILIDAITYAIRQGCTHLTDAATLTGAILVALGHIRTGAFTNNEAFLAKVTESANRQGERLWPMPMDDEYKEYIKSAFADLPNIGGRYGGSITAAMFLKEFTEDKPWVHLDIAGTAWVDEVKPYVSRGPSAVPLRTMVDLAMNWVV